MVHPGNKRLRLAKSADTGKCGNKAGLPSRIGVSLTTLRLFKGTAENCCKGSNNANCKGPATRTRN